MTLLTLLTLWEAFFFRTWCAGLVFLSPRMP